MARITQQAGISTTGVSYENEPIIKSDAAGEIMQWQPSDGGADGIYITELVEDGPAYLGIGVATPVKPLHVVGSALVKGKASFVLTGTIDPAASTTVPGVGTKFLTEISVGDEILVTGETRTVSAIASNTSLTVSAAFSNNSNDTSPECKPAAFTTLKSDGTRAFEVDNAGGVTIPGGMTFSGVIDASAGSAGAPALIFNGDTNTGLYQTGADAIGFSTGGTLRQTISDTGVGIGVAPSGGIVRAAGAYVSTDENTVHEAAVTKLSHESGNVAQLAAYGADASTPGSIRFQVKSSDGSVNHATTIDAAGTVGINEDTPNSEMGLVVVNDVNTANIPTIGAYTNNLSVGVQLHHFGLKAATSTADGSTALDANQKLMLDARGTGDVLIQTLGATGGVGIGCDPVHQFQVNHADGGVIGATRTAGTTTGDLGVVRFGNGDVDSYLAGIYGTQDGATDSAKLAFSTQPTGGSTAIRLTISSTGAVDVASGLLTVGSLDIGHGLSGNLDSTAVGRNALDSNSTHITTGGVNNTGIGAYALTALNHNDADNNTAVGVNAGAALVSGYQNTAVGVNSLMGACDDNNAAFGMSALQAFTGSNATAVGSGALDVATTAAALTAVGKDALGALSHADAIDNTAVGFEAADALVGASSAGAYNTAVGAYSLSGSVDGNSNTAIGQTALYSGDCADNNTAIGKSALKVFAGSNATAVGSGAADAAGSNASLTAVGLNALGAATSGDNNTAVGANCLASTIDGAQNTAVGSGAMNADCVAGNTGLGYSALNAFTASNATAVGAYAADVATSAGYLTAVGAYALSELTDGTGNTGVGYGALNRLGTGDYNTAVGHAAGQDVYGDHNTFMGRYAGLYASDVDHCVAIGSGALQGTAQFTEGGGIYNNDPTIEHTADARIIAGLYVTGTGIPAGAYIASITDGTHFELSASTTGGSLTGQTLTFWTNTGDYNIAIGNYALDAMTSGYSNVAVGYNAGTDLLTGIRNTLIGTDAGENLTNGFNNVAIGYQALGTEDTDSGNVAIGHQALNDQNRDNSANTAIGYLALTNLGSGVTYGGKLNTAVGFQAGGSGVFGGAGDGNGNDNVMVGYQAGYAITTGYDNVIAGNNAGDSLLTGHSNVLIGKGAGTALTNNTENIAIGKGALDAANLSEDYNVAIGTNAMGAETSGADYCVAIGTAALAAQNANVKNTAIGGLAGDAITSGNCNTLVGYMAGSDIVGNSSNTCVGYNAMVNGTGNYNVVVGSKAGSSADDATATQMSGDSNILVGHQAGFDLTTGPGNILIGEKAGANMTSGDNNIAIGLNAADGLVGDADQNIAIGRNALGGCTAATSSNIAIGDGTLKHASYAAVNTNLAIGQDAGTAITTGDLSVLIGHQAGSSIVSENGNTAVGYTALKLATGYYNTAVGAAAAPELAAGQSNVAVGGLAMFNADGDEDENTAIGTTALYSLDSDTADGNVAVGFAAGRYYDGSPDSSGQEEDDTGDGEMTKARHCVYIGYAAKGSHATTASNEVVIGNNGVGHGAHSVTLGNVATSDLVCADSSLSSTSDSRIKRDIDGNAVGLDFIEKLATVNYKRLNPADWPVEIKESRWRNRKNKQLVTHAVKAADEVWEDVVVQQACDACAEETREEVHPAVEEVRELRVMQEACDEEWEEIVHPAEEAVYEDQVVQHAQEEITEERVTQEAREEIVGERHKYDEKEVIEESTRVEFVKGDGDEYVRNEITETETRIERTPLYTDHPVVNPDGTPCVTVVSAAVEAVAGVEAVEGVEAVAATYYEEGDELPEGKAVGDEKTAAIEAVEAVEGVEAVEAQPEVTEPVIHKCAVMEEYIQQTAQEEVRETFVVQEAQEEKTETIVTPAVEEVTETITIPAVEEVTETVTIPAVEEVTERVCVCNAKEEHTERRLVREAQEEVKEEVVVVEAKDEWIETHITRPAEPAREEITERRLVSAAVEAKDAVYETVTVPADDRPDDIEAPHIGLIAQDVKAAMDEAGVDFPLVIESPNGMLGVKYGNLVMPLIKAVQELSARVKQLEA